MSKPTITEKISGFLFTWPAPENIEIQVSRLHLHNSDGRVTGELLIKDEGAPVFPQTSFNFTSDRTRASLAKSLSEKDSRPWADMINQLCLAVVDRAREGEPVQELWTNADDIKEIEFLLEPVIVKGVPTVVFGEKGVCKSTLSLVFYICLMLPWVDNSLEIKAPSSPVKTLILDYELPGYIAQNNLKHLQAGLDLPDLALYHRRCRVPLAEELEQVAFVRLVP